MRPIHVLQSWGKVLRGHTPLLSIEITRECPLHCPGCYAFGDNHLGGEVTLRDLSDKRGDELVRGVLHLVDRHKPLQVSLVGGEPMVRHRELSRILPELSRRNIYTMIVTSAVIPLPEEWFTLPRFTLAVSVDGLPEHHNVRRHPATYERILTHIAGRKVTIHLTITAAMLERKDYFEEYVRFWSARHEVQHIWASVFSPQRGEQSAECLTGEQREWVARELPRLHGLYPKLLTPEGYAQALLHPPQSPRECTFSRLSKNYSADLKTHVEPCVLGGDPDCARCGCSASAAAHWISGIHVAGPLTAGHLLHGSMRVGSVAAQLKRLTQPSWLAREQTPAQPETSLVQISDG